MLAGGLGLVDDAAAAAQRDVLARLARARGLHRVVELARRHRRPASPGPVESAGRPGRSAPIT